MEEKYTLPTALHSWDSVNDTGVFSFSCLGRIALVLLFLVLYMEKDMQNLSVMPQESN